MPKVGYWHGNQGIDGELKLLKLLAPFGCQEIETALNIEHISVSNSFDQNLIESQNASLIVLINY